MRVKGFQDCEFVRCEDNPYKQPFMRSWHGTKSWSEYRIIENSGALLLFVKVVKTDFYGVHELMNHIITMRVPAIFECLHFYTDDRCMDCGLFHNNTKHAS